MLLLLINFIKVKMKSARKIICLVVLGLLLGFSTTAFGQLDKLERADGLYRAKNFESARTAIDSALMDKEVKLNPQAWQLKSAIYYELNKKYEQFKLNSAYRDSSIKAVFISNSIMSTSPKQYSVELEYNNKVIKNHAAIYHKICKKYLEDSLNYEKSNAAYKKFKELFVKVDSTFDFKAKDIEYYSAVGSKFADKYKEDNTKTQYGEIAKIALMKVLDLDPKNVSATFNLGIVYYNQGVNLINQMSIDTPLDQLEVIQDNSSKLFKQSLPFMDKVYQLDPKNTKALEGLRQIYQALNDNEKSLEFNKKLLEVQGGGK